MMCAITNSGELDRGTDASRSKAYSTFCWWPLTRARSIAGIQNGVLDSITASNSLSPNRSHEHSSASGLLESGVKSDPMNVIS
jgi:hypothetical protein